MATGIAVTPNRLRALRARAAASVYSLLTEGGANSFIQLHNVCLILKTPELIKEQRYDMPHYFYTTF